MVAAAITIEGWHGQVFGASIDNTRARPEHNPGGPISFSRLFDSRLTCCEDVLWFWRAALRRQPTFKLRFDHRARCAQASSSIAERIQFLNALVKTSAALLPSLSLMPISRVLNLVVDDACKCRFAHPAFIEGVGCSKLYTNSDRPSHSSH